jgi:predicted secreted protein
MQMTIQKHKTRKVVLTTLLGVLVFIPKLMLPSPLDKILIISQALVLSLASVLIGRLGATYTAFIGGLLTTIIRPAFFPLTLLFAVIYGLMIDVFFRLLGVRSSLGIRYRRLVLSTTICTALVGLSSYYFTVYVLGVLPRNIVMEFIIMVAGVLGGAAGGWLTTILLRKGLERFAET